MAIKNHTAATPTTPQKRIHKNKTAWATHINKLTDQPHQQEHRRPTPAILHQKSTPPNCANNPCMTKCTDNPHQNSTTANGTTKLHQQSPHSTPYCQISSTDAPNKHTENSTNNPQ